MNNTLFFFLLTLDNAHDEKVWERKTLCLRITRNSSTTVPFLSPLSDSTLLTLSNSSLASNCFFYLREFLRIPGRMTTVFWDFRCWIFCSQTMIEQKWNFSDFFFVWLKRRGESVCVCVCNSIINMLFGVRCVHASIPIVTKLFPAITLLENVPKELGSIPVAAMAYSEGKWNVKVLSGLVQSLFTTHWHECSWC